MAKKACFIIFIIFLGGVSGIVADRYFFPYLSSSKIFSQWGFLKKSTEDITVINKTEQIYLKEESSISNAVNQAASSVVTVISIPNVRGGATPQNGTGLIVTSDGLIMTYLSAINVENSKYKILLGDQSAYDGELFGIDSYSNLVFLKINASNLPVASFGNSSDMSPGEKIIALGVSQENHTRRFNAGILSERNPIFNLSGKTLSSSEKLEGVFSSDFIKDASFVGGPVTDYSGQIIGITGSLEKDGAPVFFQIPSNKVKTVIDRAINRNLENNQSLGIYYVPLTKNYALAHGLSQEKGAMIFSPSGQQGLAIISGSPASKTDLRINDIILRVNGEEISLEKSLSDTLYKYKKGDEIEFVVLREGNEMPVKIKL